MSSREKSQGKSFEEKIDQAMEEIVAELPQKEPYPKEREAEKEAWEYEGLQDDDLESQVEELWYEDGDWEEENIQDMDSIWEEETQEEKAERQGEEIEEEKPLSSPKKSAALKPGRKKGKKKSARPKQIAYVPITEEDFSPELLQKKKAVKHKGLKVFGMASAMVAVTACCVYGGTSYYYADRFFQGTMINGMDCSGLTAYEAEQKIGDKVEDYSIQVLSRNQEPQIIKGEEINYTYAPSGQVLNLLKSQKPYQWVRGYFETKEYQTEENATYDKTLLQSEVKGLECAKEENQVEPEDAYVALNGTQFEIVPETQGSKLRLKEAYKALDAAISESQAAVDFNVSEDVYVQAAVTSSSQELLATRDAYNNYTKASITYRFGEKEVTLDGGTLKDWLEFDEKGQLVNNEASFQQHIRDFVAQLASDYDTVGTQREFHTTSGRTVYVYGSAYGWKIDQGAEAEQLTQDIRNGVQTTREPVYSMTANSHGYNDLGSTYIEVDMSSQHMYYYRDGALIFDSDIVSGDMRYEDRKTPPGIFTLYFKKSPEILKGKLLPDGTYEYETPVNYWMPFNGGIGFHDAPWQPYFGGDRYLNGGSHGCINMPPASAAYFYELIDYNVPIVCFY